MGLCLAQIWLRAPALRNLSPPDNCHTPQAARPTRIMKIAVIGGGSTYTPELVNGFIERLKTLPVTELWLMDIAWPDWVLLQQGARAPTGAAWVGVGVHLQNQMLGDWAAFDDFSLREVAAVP